MADDGSRCCEDPSCRHITSKKTHRTSSKTGGRVKKLFGDQITMVCKLDGESDVASIKLFSNGRIHLTGARSVQNAREFVRCISEVLRSSIGNDCSIVTWLDPSSEFSICMINSDCDMGFEVKRTNLVASMMRHYSRIAISYDPCMYPGVQIKFMSNTIDDAKTGTCVCDTGGRAVVKCSGKGHGEGIGDCRKITIAIFQTGRVILTGAHSIEQLDDAHTFLTNHIAGSLYEEIVLLKNT